MKVAVPVDGNEVNTSFDRSTVFIIASVESGRVMNIEEVSAEKFGHKHQKLADYLHEKGVSMVIAGNIEKSALSALINKGMDIIKGVEGSYMQVLNDFSRGELISKDLLCGHEDYGSRHEHYGHSVF
jgi:predicted Fe-Mo cluster-binding NifX family protein